MHIKTTIALSALLAAIGEASPAPPSIPVGKHKAFSVNQKVVGQKFKELGPNAVLRAYSKFGKTAPSSVKAAAATLQTGSVVANPQSYDVAYLSQVTVGNRTLNLNFDTGSSDLWVFSDLLATTSQTGHDIYNSSGGKQLPGFTWSISYGDGSGASGLVYSDKVVVGGATATAQAVEAATSVSSAFLADQQSDGLLGLAFSNINTVQPVQQTTFFDSVKASLQSALFTSNLKSGKPGTYDFGYVDPKKFTGSIAYVPVNAQSGFWQFQAGTFSVGKFRYNLAIGTAIADTGTTLIYLPPRIVNSYYAQVRGASNSRAYGGWVFPCGTSLPNFTINIGSGSFVIPGSYMNYAPIAQNVCFGGMQPNTGIGFSLLGDIFLKSVFAIWDQSQLTPRLGFAKST